MPSMLAGLALALAASDAPQDHAQAFVSAFYTWYLDRRSPTELEARGATEVLRSRRRDLDPPLAAALETDEQQTAEPDGGVNGLDFDPFVNAQETAPRYEVGAAVADGDHWRVPLSAYWGTPARRERAATAVVRCSPQCRFVDFDYGEGHTLVALLRELAAERQRLSDEAAAGKEGVGYRFVTLPGGHRFPQLTVGGGPETVARVNARILDEAGRFGCPDPPSGEVHVHAYVTYARRDVFSIHADLEGSCGGRPLPHPDRSLTFDLATGREVRFEDLFADYARDRKLILTAVFAEAARTAEGECRAAYGRALLDTSSFDMHLEESFLSVQPEGPTCARAVDVAYPALRKFAAPGGVLERAATSGAKP